MDNKYELYADLHTHTTYSHGKGSVEDNVRAAKFRGLECIAITDHGPRHPLVGVKPSRLPKIRKDIEESADKYGIDVMLGIEANIYGMSGAESIPVLEKAISVLGDDTDSDYWTATEGNAKKPLFQLLSMAKMRPDGIWSGD